MSLVETVENAAVTVVEGKHNYVTYVIIALVIAMVIGILYYAYTTFTKKQDDSSDSDKAKESLVDDFDLKETLESLEEQQRKLLRDIV